MFTPKPFVTRELTDEILRRYIAPIPAADWRPASRCYAYNGETAAEYIAKHPEMARVDLMLDDAGKLLNLRPSDPVISFLTAQLSQ